MLDTQTNSYHDTAQQDFSFDTQPLSVPRSATGYFGVSKRKDNLFQAQLSVNGKSTYLGSFRTPLEAARVYDASARKIPHLKSRLNFKDDGITKPAERVESKAPVKRRRRRTKAELALSKETFNLRCISALQQMLTAKRLFESFTQEQRALLKLLSED